jgi:hypothetical protein
MVPIQHSRFKRASKATSDGVIRLLKGNADAFNDESERPARLTATERLARLRQRTVAR